MEVAVAVVGAGAAGLSLAAALTADEAGRLGDVALLDPGGRAAPAGRTWCCWAPPGGPYQAAVEHTWPRLRVVGRDGTVRERDLAPLRYTMLRSERLGELLDDWFRRRPTVRRITAHVTEVAEVPGGAVVRGRRPDGRPVSVRARWVFDSRPPTVLPPCRTAWLQHFRGWFLRTERPVFTPDTVTWMDFRTPQPTHGLSFGYVLPLSPHRALVEYTEFSRAPLTDRAYETALDHYTRRVLRLGRLAVEAREQGAIPMCDAAFPRRVGRSVFRVGTAGGATRPATGYTFAAIQRQAAGIAEALRRGRTPLPPRPYPWRHRQLDAVLLRALDGGRLDGARYLEELFARVPLPRLLRFLDGRSTPWEEAAVVLGVPGAVWPLLRTALTLPLRPRRPVALPAPGAVGGGAATPVGGRAGEAAR